MYRIIEMGLPLLPVEIAYLGFIVQRDLDELNEVMNAPATICSKDRLDDLFKGLVWLHESLGSGRAKNDCTVDILIGMHLEVNGA